MKEYNKSLKALQELASKTLDEISIIRDKHAESKESDKDELRILQSQISTIQARLKASQILGTATDELKLEEQATLARIDALRNSIGLTGEEVDTALKCMFGDSLKGIITSKVAKKYYDDTLSEIQAQVQSIETMTAEIKTLQNKIHSASKNIQHLKRFDDVRNLLIEVAQLSGAMSKDESASMAPIDLGVSALANDGGVVFDEADQVKRRVYEHIRSSASDAERNKFFTDSIPLSEYIK